MNATDQNRAERAEQECRDRDATEADVRARLADAEKALADLRAGLAERAEEFDPSDVYHGNVGYDERSYYAAVGRCVRLIRGELVDWKDGGR